MRTVVFLGYGRTQTRLIEVLEQHGCLVRCVADPIRDPIAADVAFSFGYRHILRGAALSGCPIINLHVGYLPFNRGAHPNFWSFYEHTQPGVTIHLIDSGLDTGPIIVQRRVEFPSTADTFAKTYQHLVLEIEDLFEENCEMLITGSYISTPQTKLGTSHRVADLPTDFPGWDANIDAYLARAGRLW